MKVFIVVGTRPEAIKMAPVYKALQRAPDMSPILVSTGQHREMIDQVFKWFQLKPDEDLAIMEPNQTLNSVLSKSIAGLDDLIVRHAPSAVLAQGDTTAVISAALAAFSRQVPFGHVEAGLRTYDLERPFPEEGFRQMASRITRWHFAPTPRAAASLAEEALSGDVHVIGNTVIDALLDTATSKPDPGVDLTRPNLVLITGHRRENHGARFDAAFGSLAALARAHPNVDFVYPVHLNPAVQTAANAVLTGLDNMQLIPPVPYPQMVGLMSRARLILTDSGGIQEEAPSLGVPVLVMRDSTERQEAVEAGVAKLVGVDPDRIFEEASLLLKDDATHAAMRCERNPFGDGRSSERIVEVLRTL